MAEISRDKFRFVGIDKTKSERIVRPNLTYWQDAWRRLKRNKVALLSLIVLIVLVLMCVIQPMIAGQNYTVQNIGEMNEGPSIKHLLEQIILEEIYLIDYGSVVEYL